MTPKDNLDGTQITFEYFYHIKLPGQGYNKIQLIFKLYEFGDIGAMDLKGLFKLWSNEAKKV